MLTYLPIFWLIFIIAFILFDTRFPIPNNFLRTENPKHFFLLFLIVQILPKFNELCKYRLTFFFTDQLICL